MRWDWLLCRAICDSAREITSNGLILWAHCDIHSPAVLNAGLVLVNWGVGDVCGVVAAPSKACVPLHLLLQLPLALAVLIVEEGLADERQPVEGVEGAASGVAAVAVGPLVVTWGIHGGSLQAVEVAGSLLGVECVTAVQDGVGALGVCVASGLPAGGYWATATHRRGKNHASQSGCVSASEASEQIPSVRALWAT